MANLGYIQVTRLCNQECRFCSNPLREESLSLAQVKRYIDIYRKKRYHHILFTGGEPTLHPELAQILSYCRRKGIECRIITNAQRTADPAYLASLAESGLKHMMVSVYSHQDQTQAFLSKNKHSLEKIKKSLAGAEKLKLRVDVITVINKYNAGHLDDAVKWLAREFSFIRHFIFNNLDPQMNRASQNPDTIPRLNDFELTLQKAMNFLSQSGRTFRVERVPLCYLNGFEHFSTETRKIVKEEERSIFFLDEKGYVVQKGKRGFIGYSKPACCSVCFLNDICAGLYAAGKYYSAKELHPVFVLAEQVRRKVLADG